MSQAEFVQKKVEQDPSIRAALQADPVGTMKQLTDQAKAAHPLLTDRVIYRNVVWFLGCTLILALLCYFSLLILNVSNIPDGFVAIASGSLGALAGLLAPSPARDSG